MEELVRLKAEDYESAIDFLDLVFSQHSAPHHFETRLPRMCIPDDEHMGKHFAIKYNGRIVSMLGVYPLPVVIGGERFLFSTSGNVATHHRYEGRGYAHRLLAAAMEELKRIDADASRLGGFRQRYNRFGFEEAGTLYRMNITQANIKAEPSPGVTFRTVEENDTETLEAIQKIQTSAPFYVDRGRLDEFWLTLTAYRACPVTAYREGKLIGCICASPDGQTAEEIIAVDAEATEMIVVQWLKDHPVPSVNINLPVWNVQAIRAMSRLCQTMNITFPSLFKIIHWQRIANALCRLKSDMTPLSDGSFTVGIEGQTTLRFIAEGGKATCVATADQPDISLDPLAATRFIFGPQPPWTVAACESPLAAALLPLPLSWCLQDRV